MDDRLRKALKNFEDELDSMNDDEFFSLIGMTAREAIEKFGQIEDGEKYVDSQFSIKNASEFSFDYKKIDINSRSAVEYSKHKDNNSYAYIPATVHEFAPSAA